MWCRGEGRPAHGTSRDCWNIGLLVDRRLWIHALLRADVTQGWVLRRLHEGLRRGARARVVADQVEVLSLRGGDAERLLHQTVGLVAIAVVGHGVFVRAVL